MCLRAWRCGVRGCGVIGRLLFAMLPPVSRVSRLVCLCLSWLGFQRRVLVAALFVAGRYVAVAMLVDVVSLVALRLRGRVSLACRPLVCLVLSAPVVMLPWVAASCCAIGLFVLCGQFSFGAAALLLGATVAFPCRLRRLLSLLGYVPALFSPAVSLTVVGGRRAAGRPVLGWLPACPAWALPLAVGSRWLAGR